METRTCPKCFRAFPIEFCEAHARRDKHNKKQTSFACTCGGVPYRVIDKPEVGKVEVTSPVRIAAAKKLIADKVKTDADAAKKLETDLAKVGKVAR